MPNPTTTKCYIGIKQLVYMKPKQIQMLLTCNKDSVITELVIEGDLITRLQLDLPSFWVGDH